MPDGTRLALICKISAQRRRPFPSAGIPAYRLRDMRTRDQGLHMYVAGHGYACIRLDIRGTGESEGVITGEHRAGTTRRCGRD